MSTTSETTTRRSLFALAGSFMAGLVATSFMGRRAKATAGSTEEVEKTPRWDGRVRVPSLPGGYFSLRYNQAFHYLSQRDADGLLHLRIQGTTFVLVITRTEEREDGSGAFNVPELVSLCQSMEDIAALRKQLEELDGRYPGFLAAVKAQSGSDLMHILPRPLHFTAV